MGVYKKFSSVKISKWHAHVAYMAKHTNMVGVPFGEGPWARASWASLNPALGGKRANPMTLTANTEWQRVWSAVSR